jgi:hypothetical protein
MTQTVLSVMVDVDPAGVNALRTCIDNLRAVQEVSGNGVQAYDTLRDAVPMLHFMSITVFPDDQYDPLLVLEVNFDGAPADFWQSLSAAIGAELRSMLRLCKCPRDGSAALFKAVTGAGSTVPLDTFLASQAQPPIAQHQGHRGLARERIIQEGKLFAAIQLELTNNGAAYAALNPGGIHGQLRKVMRAKFTWLDKAAAPRIPLLENLRDYLNAGVWVVKLLIVLAVPGLLYALILQTLFPLALSEGRLPALVAVAAVALVVAAIVDLRWLEQRDPPHDQPRLDPARMLDMAKHEDHISQNHMISIVHVKPGILRYVLLHAGLTAAGLYLRLFARSGYLQSMRTIHFANWTLVSNDGRLMFNSNFDGSWASYLDDFIEKAHSGLTLVWTNGIGFPVTRFLFMEGAIRGQKFKNWARHSMVRSDFWFSAYKEYTVNQVERQVRIADGLRQQVLSEEEAKGWLLDL